MKISKGRMPRDQWGQEVLWKHSAQFWLCVEEQSENIEMVLFPIIQLELVSPARVIEGAHRAEIYECCYCTAIWGEGDIW